MSISNPFALFVAGKFPIPDIEQALENSFSWLHLS